MFELYFDIILHTYKKDLRIFLQDFYNFTQADYPHIVNYYLGIESLKESSFKELERLLLECSEIKQLLVQGRNLFLGSAYWELLDNIEDINTKLIIISKIYIYLRTSKEKSLYKQNLGELVLVQNATLESTIQNKLGDIDSQNTWVQTALNNQLSEEDYTTEGGVIFKVDLNTTSTSTQINDVVGDLTGELLKGSDINKTITFTNDDLEVLSNRDTSTQAVEILSSLRQGDNPEYPTNGIKSSFIGSSINSLGYPMLFKQITATFSNDDTLSTVSIKDLYLEGGNLILSLEIETKNKEILQTQLSL